jgi:trans-aconitate methyltransferase
MVACRYLMYHVSMTRKDDDYAVDVSRSFDPSVPQAARIYHAWLGGKDHYGVDRETADRVIELRPQVIAAARANRRFLGRAVWYMAERHGVMQFLDIGCGLPARDNTHQIAQRIDPRARVVYVDSDPVVMAHARALLTSSPDGCCDYIHADLRDTGYILDRAAQTLDLNRPVGVLLLAVLHFIPDADDPAEVVASLAGALAQASCVAITHLTGDFAPEAVGEAADAYNKAVPTPVIARTHAEVTGMFAGLRLVAPGVVPVSEWRSDVVARQVVDLYAGAARVVARCR